MSSIALITRRGLISHTDIYPFQGYLFVILWCAMCAETEPEKSSKVVVVDIFPDMRKSGTIAVLRRSMVPRVVIVFHFKSYTIYHYSHRVSQDVHFCCFDFFL